MSVDLKSLETALAEIPQLRGRLRQLEAERDALRASLEVTDKTARDASEFIELDAAQFSGPTAEGFVVPVGKARVLVRRSAVDAAIDISMVFPRAGSEDPKAPVLLCLRGGDRIAATTDAQERAALRAWLTAKESNS
jgi:hypothetical protein